MCLLYWLLWQGAWPAAAQPPPARQALVEQVQTQLSNLAGRTGVESLSAPVREALLSVPREAFLPAGQRPRAHENQALPIGFEQTMSQPLVVALMTELADVQPGERVLEVGTGSGYQSAILRALGAEVYSIEILEPLAQRAAQALRATGYGGGGLHLRVGDGYAGWPEAAPFQAIMVTAGADHVPAPLLEQLAPDGVLLIPLRHGFLRETLMELRRDGEGGISQREVLPVRFVPLQRARSP